MEPEGKNLPHKFLKLKVKKERKNEKMKKKNEKNENEKLTHSQNLEIRLCW